MEQRRIQLNILPVQDGDCIHLRFQSPEGWHNVVVDSGPETAADTFLNLLNTIRQRGETVDLLCFTHIDDDHIKGAMKAMKSPEFRPEGIRQVWLNMPGGAQSGRRTMDDYTNRSFRAANSLMGTINNHRLPCRIKILAGEELRLGDAVITAVLPIQKRLDTYYQKWEDYDGKRGEMPRAPRRDKSPTNGSSIALLCRIGERRILLSGDAFPNDLTEIGREYAGEQGFSLVKLPHHGSDANTTEKMLNALKSRTFVISTEQNEKRPGIHAMSLLSKYGGTVGGITVYGNYPWERFSGGVENVKVLVPQGVSTTENGIEVYADGTSELPFGE